MRRQGCLDTPDKIQLSPRVKQSIYALYWRDCFLGSCVAIADTIFISAGHHYNAVQDNVGDFSILVKDSQWVGVEYAAKNSTYDLLVLWIGRPIAKSLVLRGYLPAVEARVATVWLSPKPPHEVVISPGVIIESSPECCTVRGTVSTTGSSGAPVVDFFGDHVVGLHLTSNTKDGSRVSGFLPARKLVQLLAEMSISCRV